ncbi:Mu homology domain-containing protein [Thamnocephalis sphaerospora]|uniref:Mu homology domain-containing protein n=1 Tax=Thamnocephalis sphaerospora TaxID=78915 RepID=A0A4P9XX98_9FUNG|nr:Mu homology domain-containing protein [Thamnocephalis sphaerospora]|eukprot:RKP10998.1 Mu homology domain-containing protein [Thamnocephalis sphaerospora]
MDSLYILNASGGVVIEKQLRGSVDRAAVDCFLELVERQDGAMEEVEPVARLYRHTFVHIVRDGLTYLAVLNREVSPMLVLEFLQRVHDIFHDYFGDITEVVLKDNFVTVYMLLEEMSDNGHPLMTEPNALMEIIPPPTVYNRVMSTVASVTNSGEHSPSGNISNLPWRKADVRYKTNEIYFDIIEEINAITDSKGGVVAAEIYGTVVCNCKLSGMPDLSVNFSNPNILDDCSFHPCVRYKMFQTDRVVSFIPPDGQFKLLNYRVNLPYQQLLPVTVLPKLTITQEGEGRLEVALDVRHAGGKSVEDARLTAPLPQRASGVHVSASQGHCQYEPSNKRVCWEIANFSGKPRAPTLSATFHCPEGTAKSGYTGQLDFRIDGYAVSGLRVNGMALYGESYTPYKGVRSVTKSGSYQVRL